MRFAAFAPVILATLLSTTDSAQAECECLWEGSFSEVFDETDLVVAGQVIATKGNSVDLKIERLMRGKEYLPEIRVWMETADYCRPPVATFPPNSRWVMALYRIDRKVEGGFNPATPNISYGRIGDYSLSSCGGYWLARNDDFVTGNLINAPRWVHDPKMSPVLIDLVADYVNGELDKQALQEASKEDPALKDLMLDTRAFLRSDDAD